MKVAMRQDLSGGRRGGAGVGDLGDGVQKGIEEDILAVLVGPGVFLAQQSGVGRIVMAGLAFGRITVGRGAEGGAGAEVVQEAFAEGPVASYDRPVVPPSPTV